MRQMPHGQWVAFENDVPHKCSDAPHESYKRKGRSSSKGLSGNGFDDISVDGEASTRGGTQNSGALPGSQYGPRVDGSADSKSSYQSGQEKGKGGGGWFWWVMAVVVVWFLLKK
jgi:hypothetical protein